MHIAIDISPTISDHKHRGTGVYTELLRRSLKKYKPEHVYTFFIRGEKIPKNVDLVHYPYFDPFFLTLPIQKTIPTVVTVHDLIPLEYPDKFPRGVRGEIKWMIQRYSLGRANRIITDSKSSKRAIISLVNIPAEKIDIVYLAPREEFTYVKDNEMKAIVKRKYSLPGRFVLYIGDVNWNKNIPGLLQAFAIVCGYKQCSDARLVLAGISFLNNDLLEVRQIHELIRKLKLESYVIQPGFVSQEDLPVMYSLATVAVQPSFAEGFGLPVLEAMACEVPTIVSDRSSLAEISGASLKINPDSPEDLASAITTILSLDTDARTNLGRKARDWAREFSWKKVTRETINSYERALGI